MQMIVVATQKFEFTIFASLLELENRVFKARLNTFKGKYTEDHIFKISNPRLAVCDPKSRKMLTKKSDIRHMPIDLSMSSLNQTS